MMMTPVKEADSRPGSLYFNPDEEHTETPKGRQVVMLIQKAVVLAQMDLGGMSDPYVHIRVGKQTARTAVKEKTVDPVWDESFSFQIESLKDEIVLDVWCGVGGTLRGGLRLSVCACPRDGATFQRGGAARSGGDAQAVGEVEGVLRGGRGGRQEDG